MDVHPALKGSSAIPCSSLPASSREIQPLIPRVIPLTDKQAAVETITFPEKDSPAGRRADLQWHSCQHSLARVNKKKKKWISSRIKTRGTGWETHIYLPNQSRLRQQLFAPRPDAGEVVVAREIIPTAAPDSAHLHMGRERDTAWRKDSWEQRLWINKDMKCIK